MDSAALAVLKAVLDSRHGDILRLYERVEERKPRLRGSDESIDSMAYQIHNPLWSF